MFLPVIYLISAGIFKSCNYMKNKSLIIIIILAVIGIGLIAGAAVYYSKAVHENDAQPADVSTTIPEETSDTAPSSAAAEETSAVVSEEETADEAAAEDEVAGETEEGTLKHGGISPEFKKFWDEYESFVNSNAAVLNDKTNPGYQALSDRYDGYVKKAAEYENDENLTDEEVDYMASAHARISAKYASAWLGETE